MAKKAAAKRGDAKQLTITLRKSTIGFNRNQARVVEGIGLRRLECEKSGKVRVQKADVWRRRKRGLSRGCCHCKLCG